MAVVYRCAAGHKLFFAPDEPKSFTYVTYKVAGLGGDHDYNYCPHCFGEWALKNWPLAKEAT